MVDTVHSAPPVTQTVGRLLHNKYRKEIIMSCEGCKFYKGLYKGSATGYCHRHAPRPFVVAGGVDSADWSFPTVAKIEWCGEYEQRPTLHAPDAAQSAAETE